MILNRRDAEDAEDAEVLKGKREKDRLSSLRGAARCMTSS
jgi:hypothetical protein